MNELREDELRCRKLGLIQFQFWCAKKLKNIYIKRKST